MNYNVYRILNGKCNNQIVKCKRFFAKQDLKKSVLNDFHLHHEGKMVPFAGWSMPVQYKGMGILDSHKHTRSHASIFDVSHMLQTKVHGKDKEDFIESLVVGNIKELVSNTGTLSVFTNDSGGILDDNSVEEFQSQGKDVAVEVLDNGLIALQGPAAEKVLQDGVDINLKKLYFMNGVDCSIFKISDCRITRCGYTGEDGFEISVPCNSACDLAEQLLRHPDAQLAGLGARDSLRLEAGLCLYGNDIDETTTPVQGALTWCIGKRRRKEGNFPGAQIILNEIKEKPIRRRAGIVTDKITARAGAEIYDADGNLIGHITSGCPSPSIQKNIAMGYVPNNFAKAGTKLNVVVRKKSYDCTVTKMPFVKSNYYIEK